MCCLDLNHLEEAANGPDVTIAVLPKSGKLTYVEVCEAFCSHVW